MTPIQDLAVLQHDIASKQVIFIDFGAKWCGPCKMILPLIETLQPEFPSVKFLKCDIDECPDIAQAFSITSVPTLMLFKDGKLIARDGGMSRPRLRSFLENAE